MPSLEDLHKAIVEGKAAEAAAAAKAKEAAALAKAKKVPL